MIIANIIGISPSGGGGVTPPVAGDFLLWSLPSNKILIKNSSTDTLLWK